MNGLKIRAAASGDIPALSELIPAPVRALGAGFYTPAQIESGLRHAFGVDTRLIAHGTFFVAEADGAIAGCGGWSWRRKIYGGDNVGGDSDAALDPATEAARIRAFFVHPAFARRGIGSAILRECIRAAAAAGFRRLELLGTLPGERLYAASGFAVTSHVDYTLPDGVVIRWVRMARDILPGETS